MLPHERTMGYLNLLRYHIARNSVPQLLLPRSQLCYPQTLRSFRPPEQVVGLLSPLMLFTFAAIPVGSNVFNTVAQDHPGIDDLPGINRAGREPGYIDSKDQLLQAEVSDSTGKKPEYGDGVIQQESTQKGRQLSLKVDSPKTSVKRRHAKLVIAVPSVRPERREAIRKTWLNWGDDRVVLRFFIEPSNEGIEGKGEETSELLEQELMMHDDMVLLHVGEGMNSGLKLLWAMRWMSYHYSFDFFLRLDDDYFLCLEHLLDDIECLLKSDAHQSPIYAGYRACREDHKISYVGESYILFSSAIIDRVLAASDLKCSGHGSLTAGAWVTVGGPGNPEGDVAFVNDYRLDRWGNWWNNSGKIPMFSTKRLSGHSNVCERTLGIHHTYPDAMYKLWEEVSGRTDAYQSTSGDCEDLFPYEDDGKCPYVARGVDDEALQNDNVQMCDSSNTMKASIPPNIGHVIGRML